VLGIYTATYNRERSERALTLHAQTANAIQQQHIGKIERLDNSADSSTNTTEPQHEPTF
jgi:hypothetical protein